MRLWGEKSTYYYFFCKTSYPMVFPLPPSTFFEDHLTPGRGGQAHLRRSPGCCSSHFYDFCDTSQCCSSHGSPKITGTTPNLAPKSNSQPVQTPLHSSSLPHWSTGPMSHCRAPGLLQEPPRLQPTRASAFENVLVHSFPIPPFTHLFLHF